MDAEVGMINKMKENKDPFQFMSDKTLIGRYKEFHDAIHISECFNADDIVKFELIKKEMAARNIIVEDDIEMVFKRDGEII